MRKYVQSRESNTRIRIETSQNSWLNWLKISGSLQYKDLKQFRLVSTMTKSQIDQFLVISQLLINFSSLKRFLKKFLRKGDIIFIYL